MWERLPAAIDFYWIRAIAAGSRSHRAIAMSRDGKGIMFYFIRPTGV